MKTLVGIRRRRVNSVNVGELCFEHVTDFRYVGNELRAKSKRAY